MELKEEHLEVAKTSNVFVTGTNPRRAFRSKQKNADKA